MHTITSNKFSFEIIKSHYNEPVNIKKVSGASYISLPHKCEYKIRLHNNRSGECDAHIYIDGVKCGVWRIPSYSKITIERPVDEARKFVFLAESSGQASSIGAVEGAEHNGLIKVVFKPEYSKFKRHEYEHEESHDPWRCSSKFVSINGKKTLSVSNMANYSNEAYFDSSQAEGGVTGLGRRSNVTYGHTSKLDNIDHDNITILYARLVLQKRNTYSPLRPLKKRGNKYPARRTDLNSFDIDNNDRRNIERPYYQQSHTPSSFWVPSFNFLG